MVKDNIIRYVNIKDDEQLLLERAGLDKTKSKLMDNFYATRFALLLAKPFKEWDAFEHGVIDEDGDILVQKHARTREQKKTFTAFHRVVWNIKSMLSRVSSSVLVSSVAALKLLKESDLPESTKKRIEQKFDIHLFDNVLTEEELKTEYLLLKQELEEDVATTNTSGVAVSKKPLGHKKRKKKDKDEGHSYTEPEDVHKH